MIAMLTGCSLKELVNKQDSQDIDNNLQSQVDDFEHEAKDDLSKENEKDLENNNNKQESNEPQGDFAQDVIIVLDAGHGGGFSGASYNGRNEKNLTLTMALYIKEYLEENYQGMEIFLVRDKDSALSGDVKEDLELRAQYAQDKDADVLVSLHFNASDAHDQSGAMVLISKQDNVTEASKELADKILLELEGLGITNNGAKKTDSNDLFDSNGKPLDYYAINRHCAARNIPGIIVEHCYMDNKGDECYIDSDEDLRALAEADAKGIASYFGLMPK